MQKHWTSSLAFGLLCALQFNAGCSSDDDDDGSGAAGNSTTAGRGGNASGGTVSGGSSSAGRANGASASGGVPSFAGEQAGGFGGADDAVPAALSDAQILSVLDTLSLGEVTESELALPRLTEDPIIEFAEEMVLDHDAAREQISAEADDLGLELAPSTVQANLEADSDARVDAIADADEADVDAVYISGQVVAHTAALNLLTELANAADAGSLRALIIAQRGVVDGHRDHALTLAE